MKSSLASLPRGIAGAPSASRSAWPCLRCRLERADAPAKYVHWLVSSPFSTSDGGPHAFSTHTT